MHDCKPRPLARAQARIELDKPPGYPISGATEIFPQYFGTHPACAEAFALHGQIGKLINGIDDAVGGLEFQSVDDDWLRLEADMLGSQVAVSVDQVSRV